MAENDTYLDLKFTGIQDKLLIVYMDKYQYGQKKHEQFTKRS
jgi:hypothetical protein